MSAPGRIVLVRHGPSAFKVGGMFDRAGVQDWRVAYDSAGIQPSARPPATLVQMAREATHLIASDMPRRRIRMTEGTGTGTTVRSCPRSRPQAAMLTEAANRLRSQSG